MWVLDYGIWYIDLYIIFMNTKWYIYIFIYLSNYQSK